MGINNQKSLTQIADQLVNSISGLMKQAKGEEDLRIGFEKILSPLLSELKITSYPRYERLSQEAASVFKGRPDAVHGMVIIEYEPPKAFKSPRSVEHAHGQLVDYICAEAGVRKEKLFLEDPKLVGVGFDGVSIFFTKYQGDKTQPKTEFKKSDFTHTPVYLFDIQSARTFLTFMRSLSRRPLTAECLADSFGDKSSIASKAVQAFVDALKNWGDERVKAFFNEWKRLFGIVYGEQLTNSQREEVETLSSLYKIDKQADFQEILFSVHTYFALIMKLIAAEILSLKETAFTSSFSEELTHTTDDEFKARLTDIEEGGIYAKRGITNFLEGDFFRWYLDSLSSPQLRDAIREITRCLSEFEPATTIINPEATRDLLKKLYQYLVPQEVRHKLGEYYTPNWLAELLLNEVGYDGNTLKRFLDPACGSGTFLVLAIQRAKEYGRAQKEPPLETAKRIVTNIWGFDLNPLAIIAARTNYLFALGDLVNELTHLEIPVYLADSVLWPGRSGQMALDFVGGESTKVQTSIGEFHVPTVWLKEDSVQEEIFGYKRMISKAAPLIEEMVKKNDSPSEAMKRLKKENLVFPIHEDVARKFYEEILELEMQGKNGIWARFLKNAFAPMIAERFDFVVGNPPWIRWDFLSQEYRKATLPMWKNYGLFSLKGFETRLGGGKKDFSMLFTYAACDYYLQDKGKLAFLITQEVLKSKAAGEGFRRFQLGDKGRPLKVIKAHDFATVQPFEGAANKTAAIILKIGEATSYPVDYYLWKRIKGVGRIKPDATLEEALRLLQKRNLVAQPIDTNVSSWQTIPAEQKDIIGIKGSNYYKARSGAYTSPYGVYWVKIKQILSDGNLLISNLTEKGDRKVISVSEVIEPDLVFPVVRGSDIKRWLAKPEIYALITQDPNKRRGYDEDIMKQKWPRLFGYLTKFEDILTSQAAYKKYHAESQNPFYSQYNVANYTFSHFKVIWKQMTNDLFACVISQIKTPMGFKPVIPLHTTALIAVDKEEESHYICSILNSSPTRELIKSFSSAGRGFGTPSVMEHVGIPKFDPKNSLHQQLSEISKTLHEFKAKGEDLKIDKLEKQNDELVKKLFKID